MNFLRSLCLAASVAPLAIPVAAQQLDEGYAAVVRTLPSTAGNVLALPGDALAWFDGSDLWYQIPGQPQRSLLHFAVPVFGSFTVAIDSSTLLFGENSTHGLWRVPLHGVPSNTPLANVVFNYDAALLGPGRALVSAKTTGFGTPDNDLVVVDLGSGATQLLARLPGASGPVAIAGNGDVYYATSSLLFPTPPGQTAVLRLRRAIVDQALAAQQVLTVAQAELVLAGLDAAADLAFDDDGDLLFADWWNNTVGELHDATGPAPSLDVLLDYTGAAVGASGVQFTAGAGSGVFEPFQPAGGTLWVHEQAFGTLSQLRQLAAARPTLTCAAANPVPAGSFALHLDHGPRLGAGVLVVGFGPAAGGPNLTVPGFEQPLPWDATLGGAIAAWFVTYDAAGSAVVPLHNPGIAPVLQCLFQVACLDAPALRIGSTSPLALPLGQ